LTTEKKCPLSRLYFSSYLNTLRWSQTIIFCSLLHSRQSWFFFIMPYQVGFGTGTLQLFLLSLSLLITHPLQHNRIFLLEQFANSIFC
jgi:hypothetical protein